MSTTFASALRIAMSNVIVTVPVVKQETVAKQIFKLQASGRERMKAEVNAAFQKVSFNTMPVEQVNHYFNRVISDVQAGIKFDASLRRWIRDYESIDSCKNRW